MEAHTFTTLKETDNLKKIGGARISSRPQHSHQALGRDMDRFGKFGKSHSRVDVVTQDSLARSHITCDHTLDSFTQELLAELRVTGSACADGFFEIASQRHSSFSYFLFL